MNNIILALAILTTVVAVHVPSALAKVPSFCTGNPHEAPFAPQTGNPHLSSTSGNPHHSFGLGVCPGAKG